MIRAAFLNCLVVIAEYLCHKRDKDLGADSEGVGRGKLLVAAREARSFGINGYSLIMNRSQICTDVQGTR